MFNLKEIFINNKSLKMRYIMTKKEKQKKKNIAFLKKEKTFFSHYGLLPFGVVLCSMFWAVIFFIGERPDDGFQILFGGTFFSVIIFFQNMILTFSLKKPLSQAKQALACILLGVLILVLTI